MADQFRIVTNGKRYRVQRRVRVTGEGGLFNSPQQYEWIWCDYQGIFLFETRFYWRAHWYTRAKIKRQARYQNFQSEYWEVVLPHEQGQQ